MTHAFYDEESGFKLDFHFDPLFKDFNGVMEEQKAGFEGAIGLINRMENGEIVNSTAHPKESENRAVDHYNHRLEQELVPGKSLAHTLRIWEDTVAFFDKLRSGEIKPAKAEKYDTVIFNGIGGSYLGPLMMIIAKYGNEYNTTAGLPFRIYFISNTDADLFHAVTSGIRIESSIMVHLSKSGSTAETAGNMKTWMELVKAHGLAVGPHNGAVTIKDSQLFNYAKDNQFIKTWTMEVETGGRTSVCSAIGMAPSAAAGFDFGQFIKGMSYMDKLTRREEMLENPAAMIAACIMKMNKTVGNRNMIILGYSQFLTEYAHYNQQLYMESLGKEYTVENKPAGVGQTVFGGVGTGEQHSFMQQVQKGLADCFIRLMYFEKRSHDFVNDAAGSMGRQLLGFLKGTERALMQNNRPFITSTFSERNEYTLGMMIALEERIVTILGSMFNINSYDQPGVQDGKLAATAVNKLSAAITGAIKGLAAGTKLDGTAQDLLTQLKVDGPAFEAEAIFTDLCMNWNVENSYPGITLKNASRNWLKPQGLFEFHFEF